MHIIEVLPTEINCNCGYSKETITGAEAVRLGYIHGGANTPSIVKDHRKETEES